jgi:glycosyltransferase involved in cell wall biosynthesis
MVSYYKQLKHLYFYCLEIGSDSELLAVTEDWVKYFESIGIMVTVVTTHLCGKTENLNAKIIVLGGGTFVSRIKAVFQCLVCTVPIIRNRKRSAVFYHMNHKALFIQGFFLRIAKVHQTLWYSHAKRDVFLPLANRFANLILTTSRLAYPLKHSSLLAVGQAVNHERFIRTRECTTLSGRLEIVSIGRISNAKRLEKLLLVLQDPSFKCKVKLSLYGSIMDSAYAENLKRLALDSGTILEFREPVPNRELPRKLEKYSFYFTGTEKAIDKAAVEAAMVGLIIITDNVEFLKVLELGGYDTTNQSSDLIIKQQLEKWMKVDIDLLNYYARKSSQIARNKFSIENAVNLYLDLIQEEKL